jgi:hypothetical protein
MAARVKRIEKMGDLSNFERGQNFGARELEICDKNGGIVSCIESDSF